MSTAFGCHCNTVQFLFLYQLAIPVQQCKAVIGISESEQALVPDLETIGSDRYSNVLIAEFDLLHLGRRSAVTAIDDAVSAEIVIGRTLAEITAIGLEPLAVAVFFPDRLVNVVPDKAALIAAVLLIGKLGVLVQCAAGIVHSMKIFALDIGPLVALCQIFLDILDRAVHMALNISRVFRKEYGVSPAQYRKKMVKK